MTPAQFTRMSTEPQCSSTLLTALSTSLSAETSHLTRSSEAWSEGGGVEMSKEATLAPCSRNSVTIARPIPALPPVTIATYDSLSIGGLYWQTLPETTIASAKGTAES